MRFFDEKIIAIAFFFYSVAATSTFAQVEALDCTNDFMEVKEAFQKRVRNASTEFEYFLHEEEDFDIEGIESEVLDKKSSRKIQGYKYYILEESVGGMFFIILMKKEEKKAITFMFLDGGIEGIKCSNVEITKALALYQ